MRSQLLVLISVVVTLPLLATPTVQAERDPSRAQNWERRCGSQHDLGSGWYNVRANNTKCSTARHVARHYWNSGFDKHFEGWDCRDEQTGFETYRADCKRSNHGRKQHVRFAYGS